MYAAAAPPLPHPSKPYCIWKSFSVCMNCFEQGHYIINQSSLQEDKSTESQLSKVYKLVAELTYHIPKIRGNMIHLHFTVNLGALGGIPSFFPSYDFSEGAVYLMLKCAFQAVSGRMNEAILNTLTSCVSQGPQWTLHGGFTGPVGGSSYCLFADWQHSLLVSVPSGSLLALVQAVSQALGPPTISV